MVDEHQPGNAGRWSVDVGAGGCEVVRTGDPADVVLDVAELASLWLGGYSPLTLLAAGRLEVATRRHAQRLHRMFATDRAPWCPLDF